MSVIGSLTLNLGVVCARLRLRETFRLGTNGDGNDRRCWDDAEVPKLKNDEAKEAETKKAEADQIQALKDRLTELKGRISRHARIRRLYVMMGFAGVILIPGWVVLEVFIFNRSLSETTAQWLSAGIAYAFMFLVTAAVSSGRRQELDAKDLEDEIDLRQMGSASLEQKAHKLLKIQQNQLSRYLEVILQQSRGIFLVGIAAMAVGVGIVLFTIWLTKTMGVNETWEKIIVAVLGAIGAILSNYVASIFLKMFSDIGVAVQKSVSSLSQSNSVNFANVLVSNITSEEVRNETLKEIALGISKPI
jgi:uncharacterized membrane protein YdbT with pleckstrin-like domain